MKSHYVVRQPGPARISFEHGGGWITLCYYDLRECRLDSSRPDAILFLKHTEYTIALQGHNLRQLYQSLILEEVLEIPTSSLGVTATADSYVTKIDVVPNEDPEAFIK